MKLKKLLENKVIILFFVFLVIYLIFAIVFKQYYDVWWDAASYMGMGEFLFSYGKEGLFELHKPILLPVILGIFWKLSLNVVFFGKLFIFLISFLSLAFVYLISRELFSEDGERIGIISCIILFFNALFFIFIFRIYTEMLSVFSILGGIFFMIKFSKQNKKIFLFLSSLFCVLAFLSKYPNILVFGILNFFLIFYSYRKREIKSLILFNVFFLLFISPFFVINYYISGNPIYLIKISQEYFKENLGVVYSLKAFPGIPPILFKNTDFIYFKTILYLFNILLPFMFLGLYKIIKERIDKNYFKKLFLLVFPSLIFFLFFEIFYLKSERYILVVFPFLAILSAYGLLNIKFKRKMRIFTIIISIYIIFSLIFSGLIFKKFIGEFDYTNFFINPPINFSCEKAATSDPRVVLSDKVKLVVFPYEVYDKTWTPKYVIKEKPDCVFYFSCYENKSEHIEKLKKINYSLEYLKENGCLYSILKK